MDSTLNFDAEFRSVGEFAEPLLGLDCGLIHCWRPAPG